MATLRDEYDYYLAHKDQFYPQYAGKVIVLKDHEVIGVYDTDEQAVRETAKHHEMGTFLVHHCDEVEEVQYFHSRVRFDSVCHV